MGRDQTRQRSRPGDQLRARRLGQCVPAAAPVHALAAATRAALEPVPDGRPAAAGRRSVGGFLGLQHSVLRAAVLEVAGSGGDPEAVLRRTRRVRAGAGARAGVRRRAAERARVRIRDVLRRLAGVAAVERLRVHRLDAGADRARGSAPRPITGRGPGGGRLPAVPERTPRVELSPDVRDGRVLRLPGVAPVRTVAACAVAPGGRVRDRARGRRGVGRAGAGSVRRVPVELGRPRAALEQRRGVLAAKVPRGAVPARLLGPADAGRSRGVHAGPRLVRRSARR